MNTPNDDSSGRRRAALRVKQRRRQDEKTWSPSGKLLVKTNRNRRPSSSNNGRRRQSSSSSSRRPSSRPSHERPWNDRFIFEEETVLEHATQANQKRLGSATRRSVEGKENNANDTTQAKPQAASGCQSIQYTERANGEAVVEFTRSEILTSPISNVAPDNDLIGTKEVSTSPFDLDKVNAALEADAAVNDVLQTPTHESNSSLHTPQTNTEQLMNPLFSMPLDKDKVKAVLENCADLLYTIELEEELLRRDIASRDHQNHQSSTNSDCTDTERREERSEQHKQHRTEPQRIQVPPEKREQMISYINQCKSTKEQQQQVVTDLQYQEIAEILAEEILDECIADIAEQLYGHDRVA